MDNKLMLAFLIVILSFLSLNSLHAQETLYNVPSCDVLDSGKYYSELDISARPNDPQFSSFVPRFVAGVGKNVEVGVNLNGNIQPGPDTTTIVTAVKWKVYDGKENGWAVAIGDNLYIPVQNKTYDFGTYAYPMVQKTFSSKTRIGFGGYFYSKGVVDPDKSWAGGQFTFEQPLSARVGLAADWFTGKQPSAYLTAGGYYKFTANLTTYVAYSVGNINASNGNSFFYIQFCYNIN